MEIRHPGLRRFWESDDARRLNPNHVERIRRILNALSNATFASEMDLPGFRLHQLTGDRRGTYAVRVSGNWRITFQFRDEEAIAVDYEDYH